jgi:hypothetical protein
MVMRGSISSVVLIGVLCASLNGAWALDESKYPDWKGQWVRADSAEIAPWDSRKPGSRKSWGLRQQPPLTPQFQAIFEANLKHQVAGVKASDLGMRCIPAAVPYATMAIDPMEVVIPHLPQNGITTFDRALSEPWSVTQSYRRTAS